MMEKNRTLNQQDDFSMDQFAHEMEQQLLSRRHSESSSSSDLNQAHQVFAAKSPSLDTLNLNKNDDVFLDESFFNELDGWSQSIVKKRQESAEQGFKVKEDTKQIEFKLQEVEFAEVLQKELSESTEDLASVQIQEVESKVLSGDQVFPVSLPAALCDESLLSEIASIPQKMGFKIGEVADMLGIKQYVLRYWESEFDVLKPKKAPNNQRLYTRRDVENAYIIRKLLHRDRFSIEGARHAMKELKGQVRKEKNWNNVVNKIEKIEDKVTDFASEVRRIKLMFK